MASNRMRDKLDYRSSITMPQMEQKMAVGKDSTFESRRTELRDSLRRANDKSSQFAKTIIAGQSGRVDARQVDNKANPYARKK
ncbi:MAG TPA: hypothetical protein VKV24_03540 [Casimicrobiaceae bacterium]|nr:hypothetical protein [Casimicrobiaceae bacterium]